MNEEIDYSEAESKIKVFEIIAQAMVIKLTRKRR